MTKYLLEGGDIAPILYNSRGDALEQARYRIIGHGATPREEDYGLYTRIAGRECPYIYYVGEVTIVKHW